MEQVDSISEDKRILRQSILFAIGFAALLWLVRAVEWGASLNLGVFGIFPRSLSGMVGIVTAPLVHGTFIHLISNTFPLILLLVATFYFYNKIALEVFLWIYLITGFWVWVAARQAYHIGSSGIVYGLAAFLLFSGIFRKDIRSIMVAVVIAFLYNGMLQGLLPNPDQQNVSWESHLLGSVAGVFCSFYFRTSNGFPTLSPSNLEVTQSDSTDKLNHTFRSTTYFTATPYVYTYLAEKRKERSTNYKLVFKEEEPESPAIASEI